MRDSKSNHAVEAFVLCFNRGISMTHDTLPQELDAMQDVVERDDLGDIGNVLAINN